MAFNGLTDAQAERLAVLGEELGEAQQAIGKILRHGYESYHPLAVQTESNREALQRELGDLLHAMNRMTSASDLDPLSIAMRAESKPEKIKPYLHHQD